VIITRTPFRVSFFGGGTDYPAWYREHGGAVLTSSIDKYCYITARFLPPFFEHRHRIVWSKVELAEMVDRIEHPAVRAALQYLHIGEGLEIHHQADLPARTGLGSSSAFTVGLLHALHALAGRMATPRALADEAVWLEREVMAETVGIQDQVECALGGLNHVQIQTDGTWEAFPVVLAAARRRELEQHLLLYYTGVSRHASKIAEDQVRSMHETAPILKDMAGLLPEALEVLHGSGGLQEFGRLLDEGFTLKRRLSPLVSTPEIDALYEHARKWGAAGGKLLGAGGGGFLLLFASPEQQGGLRAAMHRALEVPFRFESGGSRVIYAQGT
jgi:D-glycero-alpha-D-manno-heptose-7-phosphate kinase